MFAKTPANSRPNLWEIKSPLITVLWIRTTNQRGVENSSASPASPKQHSIGIRIICARVIFMWSFCYNVATVRDTNISSLNSSNTSKSAVSYTRYAFTRNRNFRLYDFGAEEGRTWFKSDTPAGANSSPHHTTSTTHLGYQNSRRSILIAIDL